jgi:hypothetical protein
MAIKMYKPHKSQLLASALVVLSGCYFIHQDEFEAEVHSSIRIDMPFATAISILGTRGMTCAGGNPSDCSRIRQGRQPRGPTSSCRGTGPRRSRSNSPAGQSEGLALIDHSPAYLLAASLIIEGRFYAMMQFRLVSARSADETRKVPLSAAQMDRHAD